MIQDIGVEQIRASYPHVDVDSLLDQAGYFYSSLLRNEWWFVDVKSMVSQEGGRASMRWNFALEGLATDPDWDKGFKEYSKYLQRTYGANRMNNEVLHWESFGNNQDDDNRQWEPSYEATFGESLHTPDPPLRPEPEPSFSVRLEPYGCKLTTSAMRYLDGLVQRDRDTLVAFMQGCSMREAERLAGAPVGRGQRILQNLRRHAERGSITKL